jgi:uncharacterized lipoprotein YbaY
MAPTQCSVLSGTVTYRSRIALPPSAVVEVKLQDVSRADAAAITVAEQTIATKGKQVPIPFHLAYDAGKINSRYSYAVQVRILVDGKLRWISTTRNAVLTQGAPTTDIEVVVQPIRSAPQQNTSP